jgi:tRNA-dihydrouridine synthase
MIGRGVFTNPYAFSDEIKERSRGELLGLLTLQLDLFDQYTDLLGPRPFDPLKRFFKIYVRDFPGAAELRDQLMHAKSTDEARTLLRQMPAESAA